MRSPGSSTDAFTSLDDVRAALVAAAAAELEAGARVVARAEVVGVLSTLKEEKEGVVFFAALEQVHLVTAAVRVAGGSTHPPCMSALTRCDAAWHGGGVADVAAAVLGSSDNKDARTRRALADVLSAAAQALEQGGEGAGSVAGTGEVACALTGIPLALLEQCGAAIVEGGASHLRCFAAAANLWVNRVDNDIPSVGALPTRAAS